MTRIGNFLIFNYTSHPLAFGHREGDRVVVDFLVEQDGQIDVITTDETQDVSGLKVYKRRYQVPEEVYKTLSAAKETALAEGLTAVVYVSSTTIQALRGTGFTPPDGLIVGEVKIISPRGQRPVVAEAYGVLSV